jgi:hypothetical protein
MIGKRTRPNSTKKSTECASRPVKRRYNTRKSRCEDAEKHVQVPLPNSKIARINALNPKIDAIKATIDARQHMKLLALTNGEYCLSCSPTENEPGSCDALCALLRPQNGSSPGTLVCVSLSWIWEADEAKAAFENVVGQMERFGHDADDRRVEMWEDVVEEMYRDIGMRSKLPWRGPRAVPGLDLTWKFDRVGGKGPGLEDEVAPEEMC